MIRKVEIKNFRILKDIKQELKPFNILIGPNATGKSTFLDAISLVRDILNDGLEPAIEKRSPSFYYLLWDKTDPKIEINLELELPEKVKNIYSKKSLPFYIRSRYDLKIGFNQKNGELQVLSENLRLFKDESIKPKKRKSKSQPNNLRLSKIKRRWDRKALLIRNTAFGLNYFFSETEGDIFTFKTSRYKTALENLPEDQKKFPGALWTKHKLKEGIQTLNLNSLAMRQPCPPGRKHSFEMDGSNLPLLIKDLEKKSAKLFKSWLAHLRTALPLIKELKVKEREEDRSLYLQIKDENGRMIPSWLLSDGALRVLALTLLAYLPENEGIYLIEEPENGIHPLAIEPVYQSFSSLYDGQIIMATHSPVFMSVAKPEQILCFSRKENGEAQIIKGNEHPALKNWKGSPNLNVLYASGVLD